MSEQTSRSKKANPVSNLKPKKLDETAERALDFYLKPKPDFSRSPDSCSIFTVNETLDSETLLANLSETLASANAMLSDLAFNLEGSNRHVAFGVQQMVELSELLANRALDVVDPR
ncbi:DUF6124 family protein [Pseudomonas sp. B21-056]|jgi:hypothetical protein|uniref:DUF6124 family protein n=1 Tax=Pseudomonas sp. B21-056 TaxID=2895495 RepID=UPI00223031DE|nr:DUF6124 family protein [Pseudomonas sp. B21-056]UZE24285.1 DUF6124 family protein [Pseudomonas sp. B21-056]